MDGLPVFTFQNKHKKDWDPRAWLNAFLQMEGPLIDRMLGQMSGGCSCEEQGTGMAQGTIVSAPVRESGGMVLGARGGQGKPERSPGWHHRVGNDQYVPQCKPQAQIKLYEECMLRKRSADAKTNMC